MLALCLMALSVSPCSYSGWGQEDLERLDGVKIVGSANRYAFHLVSEKPHASGSSATYFMLTEPRRMWGFGQNGCRFLDMTVNGIPLAKTVVSEQAFRYGRCGARLRLNFDGAALDLAAYMKEDSPLLWFTLRPAKEQLRRIETLSLSLKCVVSDYRAKKAEINRYVQTATRTLGPSATEQPLAPDDRHVLIGDNLLDGSAPGRGYGPSYIQLGDPAAVRKACVFAPHAPEARVTIDLRPDFTEYTFAILQTQGAITKEEILKP